MISELNDAIDREIRDQIAERLSEELGLRLRRVDLFETEDSMGDRVIRVELSVQRQNEPVGSDLFYRLINLVGEIMEQAKLSLPSVVFPYIDDGQRIAERA